MENRELQQANFAHVGSDPGMDNGDTVLQVFRSAHWQTASSLGSTWAGGQLSGERLDRLATLLDGPRLSAIDRKAIAFRLTHAAEGKRAAYLLDHYQLD